LPTTLFFLFCTRWKSFSGVFHKSGFTRFPNRFTKRKEKVEGRALKIFNINNDKNQIKSLFLQNKHLSIN